VLTELLQNSVEHAFPDRTADEETPLHPIGRVILRFERGPSTLRLLITDDGIGLPQGQTLESMANLGLQIVRTLVESELGGTLSTLPPTAEGALAGSTFELLLPLP